MKCWLSIAREEANLLIERTHVLPSRTKRESNVQDEQDKNCPAVPRVTQDQVVVSEPALILP